MASTQTIVGTWKVASRWVMGQIQGINIKYIRRGRVKRARDIPRTIYIIGCQKNATVRNENENTTTKTIKKNKKEASTRTTKRDCFREERERERERERDVTIYFTVATAPMIFTISILVVISSCLYWLYKYVRGPAYIPGMVKETATKSTATSSSTSSASTFDDPSLYSKTTESKWIMPDGVEIYFFPPSKVTSSSSSVAQAILCVHGGPSMAPEKPWEVCHQLSDVYLYHCRGCGQSTRPIMEFPSKGMWPGIQILAQTLGIATQVGDIERIRRRLNVPKLDLVGHSFGGFLATLYTCEFPEHVRSLTLLTPASVLILPPPKGSPDLFQVMGDRIRAHQDYHRTKYPEDQEDYVAEYEAFFKRYLDFSNFPKETEETLQQRQFEFAFQYARAYQDIGDTADMKLTSVSFPPIDTMGGMAHFAQFISMGMEHNYLPICKEMIVKADLKIPVSIVHGEKDMLPESCSQQYQEIFPMASFEVIPDERHFLMDHPRVIEIIKETIDKASSD